MEYLKVFGDPKNDFINHLIYKLSYEINFCINRIYNNCKCELKDNKNNILFVFQKLLEEIPNWDKKIIKNETIRIKNRIPIIEDLFTCILISNTRLLCSFKNNQKIKIKVPKISLFIHKCYILIAKELWQYTYLFNENIDKLSIQKNKKIINDIIKNNIENVIMIFLPIKSILKCYIDNNLNNNNELQISETLNNILTKKEEQKNTYFTNDINNNKNNDYNNNNQNNNQNNETIVCTKVMEITTDNIVHNSFVLSEKTNNNQTMFKLLEDTKKNINSKNEEKELNEQKLPIKNETLLENISLNINNNLDKQIDSNKEQNKDFIKDFEFNTNCIIIDKPIKLYNNI
jgi:hypothetical protein